MNICPLHTTATSQLALLLSLANKLADEDKELGEYFMTWEFAKNIIQYANVSRELEGVFRTIFVEGRTQLQVNRYKAKPEPAIVRLVVRLI